MDSLSLIVDLVFRLWASGRYQFIAAVAVGLLLAALAWWLAHAVALNFNRQFSFRPQHYVYCGMAATATFLFTIVFFSLRYTADVAQALVSVWEVTIQSDQSWADDTFRQAFDAVRDLRDPTGKPLEDFSGRPAPDSDLPTTIPTNREESKNLAAEIYAKAAVTQFRTSYPFLSKVLWARSGLAQDEIYADMRRVFDSGRPTYDAKDAVRLAGASIRQGLEHQVPRIVLLSRIALVVAFLLIQGITFALLIHAALADIKVRQIAPSPGGR
jgi:hypothetical protein